MIYHIVSYHNISYNHIIYRIVSYHIISFTDQMPVSLFLKKLHFILA